MRSPSLIISTTLTRCRRLTAATPPPARTLAGTGLGNDDWDDAWVFTDSRFQLADGPDQMLLDFLAYMAHPIVQPDTGKAIALVTRLNSLLSPDGWELRATAFISARPVYAAVRIPGGPGRMIRLEINDGDPGRLDLVLGQACQILGDGGHDLAQGLITAATLTLRPDSSCFTTRPQETTGPRQAAKPF